MMVVINSFQIPCLCWELEREASSILLLPLTCEATNTPGKERKHRRFFTPPYFLYFSTLLVSKENVTSFFGLCHLILILDSAAVSIFVVILIELTNTVFVNSTNITTNIETAVLSRSGRTYDCPPHEACAYYWFIWFWVQILSLSLAMIFKLRFWNLTLSYEDPGFCICQP